jgi:hypothetical protein
MDKDRIAGAGHQAKGAAKQAAGKVNPQEQSRVKPTKRSSSVEDTLMLTDDQRSLSANISRARRTASHRSRERGTRAEGAESGLKTLEAPCENHRQMGEYHHDRM